MADRLTIADINLGQYMQNIAAVREVASPGTKIMAVMKANAYGHGLKEIAGAAVRAGVEYLGVVSINEARCIRQAGVHAPILIMNHLDGASLHEAATLSTAVTLMDLNGIHAAEEAAQKNQKVLDVHLKIDTGMHRAGCRPEEVASLAEEIQKSSHLHLEGVMTHFAEAEADNTVFTLQQLTIFQKCLAVLKKMNIHPPLIHAANSAATMSLPETHFTMVRPGLVTYGLNPFTPTHPAHVLVSEKCRPILTLKTQVMYVRDIAIGETVGYNRTWRAERESRVALLPVGYGDGYRRGPQNAGYVLVRGKKASIVGSVSMDQTTVDVTDIEGVSPGDEVLLMGTQGTQTISAQDIANQYGTIDYEVMTALSARIQREYHQ